MPPHPHGEAINPNLLLIICTAQTNGTERPNIEVTPGHEGVGADAHSIPSPRNPDNLHRVPEEAADACLETINMIRRNGQGVLTIPSSERLYMFG